MNQKDDDDMEMRKSSTMNSMFIGSTISKPNVNSIINAVATILHSQMLEVSKKTLLIYMITGSKPRQKDREGK